MGESKDERLARKKQERKDFLAEQREHAANRALEEASDKDPQVADWLDNDLDNFVKQNWGVSMAEMSKIENASIDGVTKDDVIEAQRVIRQARREAKGGWFLAGNPRKAAKRLKSSKAVNKVAGAAKKKKDGCFGCAVVALLMLTGAAGSAIWGAVELVVAFGI